MHFFVCKLFKNKASPDSLQIIKYKLRLSLVVVGFGVNWWLHISYAFVLLLIIGYLCANESWVARPLTANGHKIGMVATIDNKVVACHAWLRLCVVCTNLLHTYWCLLQELLPGCWCFCFCCLTPNRQHTLDKFQ